MQLSKGLDVSHHQNDRGAIDWSAVIAQGYEFVFVKLTEGTSFIDPCGRENIANARKAGAKIVGGYHFSRFNSVNEALAEAKHFASIAKDLALDYVILDIEHPKTKGDLSDATCAFLDAVKAHGRPLLYSYPAFINAHLKDSCLSNYPLWIAHYGVSDPRDNSVWGNNWLVWQHASDANVSGIHGDVDVNVAKPEFFIEQLSYKKPNPAPKPKLLQKGDEGAEVEAAQLKLIRAGEKLPKYGADGDFGDETEIAVKSFQRKNGLVVDGIIGPKTIAKLNEVITKKKTKSSAKSIVPYPGHAISRGSDDRKNVERIQRAVNIKVDGIFGKNTEDAVKEYQKRHNLADDGVVGPRTWAEMF